MQKYLIHLSSLFVSAVFITLASPSVYWGDGGFIVSSAYVLGIPHPTGHPLFSMLGKIFTFVPIGSIPFRLNIMSILFCAGSLYLLYYSCKELSKISFKDENSGESKDNYALFYVLCALSFLFSEMMLFQAGSVETYAINTFFSLAVIALVLKGERLFHEKGERQGKVYFYAAVFLLFVGYGNHSLLIACLGLALFVYYVFFVFKKLGFRSFAVILLLAAIGASVYLYLPLRAQAGPHVNLGNPRSFEGFLWVFTGEQFRENAFSLKVMFNGFDFKNFAFVTGATLKTMLKHLYYFWPFFVFAGALFLYKRSKPLFIFLLFAVLVQIAVTYPPTFYTKVPLEDRGVVGYYLVPLALCYLAAALGIEGLWKYLRRTIGRGLHRKFVLTAAIIFAAILFNIIIYSGPLNRSKDYTARIYGKTLLSTSGWEAVLLASSDAGLFNTLYMQSCENHRNDVYVINKSMFFHDKGIRLLTEDKKELFADFALREKPAEFTSDSYPSRNHRREEAMRAMPKETLPSDGARQAPKIEGPFNENKFKEWAMSVSLKRPLYFETGSDLKIDKDSLYPNVLSLGLGIISATRLNRHLHMTDFVVSQILDLSLLGLKNSFDDVNIALFNIGNYFLERKDYENAQRQYLNVLKLDPFMERAASNLMPALILSQKYSHAVSIGSELIKNIKTDTVYYNYAVSLLYLNRKSEALEVLRDAPLPIKNSPTIKALLNQINKEQ